MVGGTPLQQQQSRRSPETDFRASGNFVCDGESVISQWRRGWTIYKRMLVGIICHEKGMSYQTMKRHGGDENAYD